MAGILNDQLFGDSVLVTTTVTAGTDIISTAGGLSLQKTSDDMSIGVISMEPDHFIHARGTGNTFIGIGAGNETFTVASAINNTALGVDALSNLATGSDCIAIGKDSGTAWTTNESNCIAVGHSGVILDQDTTRIGTTQTKAFMAGVYSSTPATVAATGVALADSAGQLGSLGAMADGELVIGSTGSTPVVGSLASAGGTVTITAGAGTINLEAGGSVAISFLADDTNSAVPALGVLTVAGGANITTSAAGSTITNALDADLTAMDSVTFNAGGSLQTGTTAADTLLIQAYDVDGTAYVPFITLTANNTPTCDLSSAVTIGSSYIYRAGGTDVPVADGGTGVSTLTQHGILMGNGATDIQATAEPTDGQILIGKTGDYPQLATLTAGTGVSVTNGAGSITVAASGGGFSWSAPTVDATLAVANGYIANKAGLLTMTLPATAALGDTIKLTNMNTAVGLRVAQNANQQIRFGTSTTAVGIAGYIETTELGDSAELVCVVAGASTVWHVLSSIGNWTVA